MAVPSNGVYRLAPFKNINQVIDISGMSQSDYANAMIYAPNNGDPAGNHQKTFFYPTTADPSKYSFMFLHSKKRLDKEGASLSTKSNAIQYHAVDYLAQWWTPIEDTTNTGTLNGETINSFEIALSNSLGTAQVYCLDYANGQTANSTNVQVHYHNDTVAQRWFFVPDCYFIKTNPVPSNLGLSTSVYGDILSTVKVGSGTSLYPAWICNWDKFQLRYRVRGRVKSASHTSWSDWGYWYSPTGLTTHDGWGNVWDENCTPTASKTYRWASAITPTLDWSTYDAFEVQIQARSWTDDAITLYTNPLVTTGGSGSSCVSTVTLVYNPTFTIGSPTFSPDGLSVVYTSDWAKGYESITVESVLDSDGNELCSGYTEYSVGQNGTIVVPIDNLRSIPADGDNIYIRISANTIDASISASASKLISYSGISGSLSVTQSIEDDVNTISFSESYSTEKVYLAYMNNGLLTVEETTKSILPPFNVPYQIIAFAKNDGDWNMAKVDGEVVKSNHYSWDTNDESVKLNIFKSRYGNNSNKFSRDSEFFKVNGNRIDRGFQGDTAQSDIDVDGVVRFESISAFERIKVLEKPLFRSVDGKRCKVIVTDMENAIITKDHVGVSIKQRECI